MKKNLPTIYRQFTGNLPSEEKFTDNLPVIYRVKKNLPTIYRQLTGNLPSEEKFTNIYWQFTGYLPMSDRVFFVDRVLIKLPVFAGAYMLCWQIYR